nr:MAG TPA: hypothetical protein [Caudoviricetes sp.]
MSLKVSTIETTADNVNARGGWGYIMGGSNLKTSF